MLKIVIPLILSLWVSSAQAKSIKLSTTNVCSLETDVSASSMQKLKYCLIDKVSKRRGRNYPIYLYLNSPGGSIYHGLRFITFAKSIRNLHTITEFSASMAAAIAQGLPGKRYVVETGVFMFHRARGGFQGQFEDGELESRLNLWKKIVRNMESMQAKRIGITLKEYKKRRVNEWWVYGDDNVKQNTADDMAEVRCTPDLIKQETTVVIRTMFGSSKVKVSGCPLVN